MNDAMINQEENNFKNKYNNLLNILQNGGLDKWVFEGLYNGGVVYIVDLRGNQIPINITYTDKISDLRRKIEEIQPPPQLYLPGLGQHYELIFGSKILRSWRTLFHYKIPINGKIYITYIPNDNMRAEELKDRREDEHHINDALNELNNFANF